MTHHRGQEDLAALVIKTEDDATLRLAQRLAAADVDVKLALSHAWWTGLRQGLEAAGSSPLKLPSDPFRTAELERIRDIETPF